MSVTPMHNDNEPARAETKPGATVEAEPVTVPIPPPPATAPPMPPVPEGEEAGETLTPQEVRRLSRRSFIWAGITTAASLGGLWAFNKYAPADPSGIKLAFRNSHEFNEEVAQSLFFRTSHQDRQFDRSLAVEPPNNYKGETPMLEDISKWRLQLSGSEGAAKPLALTLADIQKLPKISQTTELKCVEGWSKIVNWSGARLIDFMAHYPPPTGTRYLAMRSEPEGWEDEWFYVGLDMPACQHPQSLLAWQMNGEDLTPEHGAPLRLVMPHKYGIKNIKLITHIAYMKERPKDYWAEQGYDWYAGL